MKKMCSLLLCAVMLLTVFSLHGDASDLAVRPWTEPTTPEEHQHVWTPADCVTPLYCKECGKMMGDPLGHQLVNSDIPGYVTCTVCGYTAKASDVQYGTSTDLNKSSIPSAMPVAADGGMNHSVILYSDGTVSAIGDNSYGQCNVSNWTNVIQVSAGFNHTVAVCTDGTVVATGSNSDGQCNVSSWRNIVQVAAGEAHTLGLRSDGTVVAVGRNTDNQCNVTRWSGITQIAAAKVNSLGLTAGGQIIVRGAFTNLEDFYVGGWTDVISVECGTGYIAGIKANNTVVGTGHNTDPEGRGYYSDISVSDWRDIVQLAGGRCNMFALTRDGYVLSSGRNDFGQMGVVQTWSQIAYIGAGVNHVIGIRKDGSLVAAGDNSYGKCNVNALYPNSTIPNQSSAYLNELPCLGSNGKLWTRSNTPTPANCSTPADVPGCWSNVSIPGHTSGPVRDNRGNEYTFAMHVDGSEAIPYSISYQLNGSFKTFSGVCGYPENVISTQWAPQYTKYFQIYGDGRLLYTSPSMNVHTAPVPFEFSVENVNVLTITYPGTEGPNEAATLFDPMVR